MAVPEGFEGTYRREVILVLIKQNYGLKNTAKEFWIELFREFSVMVCGRSDQNSYIYFKWKSMGLLV